jgi:hypothetical protein
MYFIHYASRIKFNTISTSPRYAYAFFQLKPQRQAYSIIKPHSYIHNKRGQYFNIQTFTLDATRWAKTSTTLVAVMLLIHKLFNAPKETRALRDPFFLFLWKLIPIPLRLYWKQRRTRETSSSPLSQTHIHAFSSRRRTFTTKNLISAACKYYYYYTIRETVREIWRAFPAVTWRVRLYTYTHALFHPALPLIVSKICLYEIASECITNISTHRSWELFEEMHSVAIFWSKIFCKNVEHAHPCMVWDLTQ